MAPSPPKSPRGLRARLTAKAGPLPVWGWAVVILGSYLLYTRLHRGTSSATPVTAGPTAGSGSQQPASGQGNAADNLNSDLLTALLGNQQANQDALLAAIQSTTAAGAAGGAGAGAVGPSPVITDPVLTDGFLPFVPGPAPNNAPPSAAAPNGPAASASPYTQTDTGSFVFTPVVVGSNPAAALSGAEVTNPFARVGTDGTVASAVASSPTALVDPSGHVVNAKGARVGGRTAE